MNTTTAPAGTSCRWDDCTDGVLEADGFCDTCGRTPPAAATGRPRTSHGAATAPSGAATAPPRHRAPGPATGPAAGPATAPAAGSATAPTGTGSRWSRPLSTAPTGSRSLRGGHDSDIPPVPRVDPVSALMTDPQVPEHRPVLPPRRPPPGRPQPRRPPRPLPKASAPRTATRFSFAAEADARHARRRPVRGARLPRARRPRLDLPRRPTATSTTAGWCSRACSTPTTPEASPPPDAEKRFLATVDHPGIVSIHNFVQHVDATGSRWPLHRHGVRRRLVAQADHGSPPPRRRTLDRCRVAQAIAYALEVLPALGYLHGQGHAYCDFKPDNVIQYDQQLTLIDLGAVIRFDDEDAPSTARSATRPPRSPGAARRPPPTSTPWAARSPCSPSAWPRAPRCAETALPDDHPVLARYESFHRLLLRATDPDPDCRLRLHRRVRRPARGRAARGARAGDGQARPAMPAVLRRAVRRRLLGRPSPPGPAGWRPCRCPGRPAARPTARRREPCARPLVEAGPTPRWRPGAGRGGRRPPRRARRRGRDARLAHRLVPGGSPRSSGDLDAARRRASTAPTRPSPASSPRSSRSPSPRSARATTTARDATTRSSHRRAEPRRRRVRARPHGAAGGDRAAAVAALDAVPTRSSGTSPRSSRPSTRRSRPRTGPEIGDADLRAAAAAGGWSGCPSTRYGPADAGRGARRGRRAGAAQRRTRTAGAAAGLRLGGARPAARPGALPAHLARLASDAEERVALVDRANGTPPDLDERRDERLDVAARGAARIRRARRGRGPVLRGVRGRPADLSAARRPRPATTDRCPHCGHRADDASADGYCPSCGLRLPDGTDHVEVAVTGLAAVSDRGHVRPRNEDAMALGRRPGPLGDAFAASSATACRRSGPGARGARRGRRDARRTCCAPMPQPTGSGASAAAVAAGAAAAAALAPRRPDAPSCTLVCASGRPDRPRRTGADRRLGGRQPGLLARRRERRPARLLTADHSSAARCRAGHARPGRRRGPARRHHALAGRRQRRRAGRRHADPGRTRGAAAVHRRAVEVLPRRRRPGRARPPGALRRRAARRRRPRSPRQRSPPAARTTSPSPSSRSPPCPPSPIPPPPFPSRGARHDARPRVHRRGRPEPVPAPSAPPASTRS